MCVSGEGENLLSNDEALHHLLTTQENQSIISNEKLMLEILSYLDDIYSAVFFGRLLWQSDADQTTISCKICVTKWNTQSINCSILFFCCSKSESKMMRKTKVCHFPGFPEVIPLFGSVQKSTQIFTIHCMDLLAITYFFLTKMDPTNQHITLSGAETTVGWSKHYETVKTAKKCTFWKGQI
jgi:hypothetical protein